MASGGYGPLIFTENQLRAMTVPNLKNLLRSFNLPCSGLKPDLIHRLLSYYNSNVYNEATPLFADHMSFSLQEEIDRLEKEATKLNLELEITRLNQKLCALRSSTPKSSTLSDNMQTTPIPISKPQAEITHVSSHIPTVPVSACLSADAQLDLSDDDGDPKPNLEPVPMQFTNVQPPSTVTCNVSDQYVNKDDMRTIIKMLSDNQSVSRLPTSEPPVFSGDPLSYNNWEQAFSVMIDKLQGLRSCDKLYFLKKYLRGSAFHAVDGFHYSDSSDSYQVARELLRRRFGDSFVVSEAYRTKLDEWPKVSSCDSKGLRAFADFLAKCLAAMKDVPELSVLNDSRQNQAMLRLLPDYIVAHWNEKVMNFREVNGTFPPFSYFVGFIQHQSDLASNPITSLEAVKNLSKRGAQSSRVSHFSQSFQPSCAICRGSHKVFMCEGFKKKSAADRQSLVREKKLCFLCLNEGHGSRNCTKKLKCKECGKRHNTLLHQHQEVRHPSKETSKGESSNQANCGSVYNASRVTYQLSTMIVPVVVSSKSNPSVEYVTYAMLDTQSDTTFVTDEVAENVNAQTRSATLKLSTMTSKDQLIKCEKITDLTVRGYLTNTVIDLPNCFTRSFIPHNPSHLPSPATAKAYAHLRRIAEHIPPKLECTVGLLIGYDCPKALEPTDVIHSNLSGGTQPYAVETALGWSIVGKVRCPAPVSIDEVGLSHRICSYEVPESLQVCNAAKSSAHFVNRTKIHDTNAEVTENIKQLKGDFCTGGLESVSQDDIRFLDILSKGICQDPSGHYEMPLPFKENKPLLPNNRRQAISRFRGIQSRLNKSNEFKNLYVNFINDMIKAGEAELVPEGEPESQEVWYLPHHGVLNPNKPGKIRVVFDGSCQYEGHSLNQYLLQGPDLNNNLVGVLTRFRKEPVAVACDIAKMYHQFRVSKSCRDYLRFLWFHPLDETKVVDYRMTVHVFGATSSPSCAKFGLLRVASDHGSKFPDTKEFISKDFYVDDGLSSRSTDDEAIKLLQEAREVCSAGKLKLHKLLSNSVAVLQAFPKDVWATDIERVMGFPPHTHTERMLGMHWCMLTDEFSFVPKPFSQVVVSRRSLLSSLASVFDPLGLIAPFLLLGKQIFQKSSGSLSWDDLLPDDLVKLWLNWITDLQQVSSVNLKRCFRPSPLCLVETTQIHTFSDASEKGYGACSYLRLCDNQGKVHCSLLLGKAKVTPKRGTTTIPRLELQAALLAAKIGHTMSHELGVSCEEFYYTDSKIVLGYIGNSSKRFRLFVANRVSQIRSLTSVSQWQHVIGADNPADHASRGLSVSDMLESNWFRGPDFLWSPNLGVTTIEVSLPDDDPEIHQGSALVVSSEESPIILTSLERFSSWQRAIRVASMIYKVVRMRGQGEISTDIIGKATFWLLSMLQQAHFSDDYSRLIAGEPLRKGSSLWKLDPYVDDDGLLRVGGRMKHAAFSLGEKHPIILPSKAHITTLVCRYYHQRVGHQGRGCTVSAIREAGYWILGCSSKVSSLIHFCVTCRLLRRPNETQKMADLPSDRMTPAPPFSFSGCDCFGPFMIKDGRKTVKRYGVIFTCLASRGVHLELLDDLSTDAFINGLRCVMAIRGPIKLLRCDRGTNFVGAARELQRAFNEMCDDSLQQFLLTHGCDFQFNPPGASHMGGVWERLIRTVRNVLSGVLFQSHGRLDVASARTLFYEVMSIVNGRPITTVDGSDDNPLTPNHLLWMRSDVIIPPPGDFKEVELYTRKRWRRVQSLAELFWRRWKVQYLSTLQSRSKWQHKKRNLANGDVVLIKEGSMRMEWKRGRVVESIASGDGLVRRVRIQVGTTKKGPVIWERPISKLVTLLEAAAYNG